MDSRTILHDLRVLARGAGEAGSLPRRPRFVRRFGTPLLLLLTLLLGIGAVSSVENGEGWSQIVAFTGVVPLALIVFRPLVAWRLVVVVATLSEFAADLGSTAWPWGPVSIPVALAVLFAVAATQLPVVTSGVWAVTCGLVIWQVSGENTPGVVILVTVVLLVGDQVRRRRRAQHHLRTAEERSAVLAERARIARELHDVVAHHMSMIAVRAETAQYRLGDVAEPVREELGQISAAARDGLVEMRRLLGVLRSENQEPPIAPQPGLDDLARLVETARAAGATVTLEPLDDPAGIPPAVGLTAYRIVQEALSNAGRHAPGAAVSVVLRRVPEGLAVDARNGPADTPGAAAGPGAGSGIGGGVGAGVPTEQSSDRSDRRRRRPRWSRGPREGGERVGHGPGHGLRGMRERVAMLDGALTAGQVADGGFEVRAVLPLAEPDMTRAQTEGAR